MKLTQLAKKPELIEIELNDDDIIKEYGEPIQFYTWDRAPMDVFSKLAGTDHTKTAEMVSIVRDLILDESGRRILSKDQTLPSNVMIKTIAKIVEKLGN